MGIFMSKVTAALTVPSEFMEFIKVNSITSISAEYSGFGDDGYFDSIEAESTNKPIVLKDVEESIKDIFYGLLDQFAGGWEVDDGGYGSVRIDFSTPNSAKITISNYSRVLVPSNVTLNCLVEER